MVTHCSQLGTDLGLLACREPVRFQFLGQLARPLHVVQQASGHFMVIGFDPELIERLRQFQRDPARRTWHIKQAFQGGIWQVLGG